MDVVVPAANDQAVNDHQTDKERVVDSAGDQQMDSEILQGIQEPIVVRNYISCEMNVVSTAVDGDTQAGNNYQDAGKERVVNSADDQQTESEIFQGIQEPNVVRNDIFCEMNVVSTAVDGGSQAGNNHQEERVVDSAGDKQTGSEAAIVDIMSAPVNVKKRIDPTVQVTVTLISDSGENVTAEKQVIEGTVKRYRCKKCDIVFINYVAYHTHMLIHKPVFAGRKQSPEPDTGLYKCKICGKLVQNRGALHTHMNSHSRTKTVIKQPSSVGDTTTKTAGQFECTFCGRFFKNNGALHTHLKIHQPKETSKSDVFHIVKGKPITSTSFSVKNIGGDKHDEEEMGEETSETEHRNSLESVQRGLGLFKCHICDEVFKYAKYYRKHLKQHKTVNGESPDQDASFYKCDLCDRKCRNKGALATHKRSHYSKQNIENDKSHNSTSLSKSVEESGNEKEVTEMRDNKNDEEAMSEETDEHEQKDLDESVKMDKNHDDYQVSPLQCPMCDVFLINTNSYKAHIESHGKECFVQCSKRKYSIVNLQSVNEEKKEGEKEVDSKVDIQLGIRSRRTPKIYICEVCEKVFNSQGGLTLHMQNHQGQRKPFKCPHCDLCVANKGILARHLQVHSGVKWDCDECQRKFDTQNALILHKQVHEGQKTPFKCPICEKTFTNKGNLQRHIGGHSQSFEKWSCNECEKECTSKNGLFLHKQLHEGQKKSFRCPVCDKTVMKNSNIERHMQSHGLEKWPCDECVREFTSYSDLICHKRQSHEKEKKPWECQVCGKTLMGINGNIQRHMQRHNLETEDNGEESVNSSSSIWRHVCPECNQCFDRREYLRKHMNTHHPGCSISDDSYKRIPVELNVPKLNVSTDNILTGDSSSEGMHQCTLCHTNFTRRGYLTKHWKKHHPGQKLQRYNKFYAVRNVENGRSNTETIGQRFLTKIREKNKNVCKRCSKTFSDKTHLLKHMRSHFKYKYGSSISHKKSSNDNKVDDEEDVDESMSKEWDGEEEGVGKERFPCPKCNEIFRVKSDLDKHLKTHEENTSEGHQEKNMLRPSMLAHSRQFKCLVCNKSFKFRKYLNRHKVYHASDKTHKCEVCSKYFATEYLLKCHAKIHMKIRTTERCFKCDKCDKSFLRSVDLQNHQNTHITQLFKCNLCGKSFRQQLVLDRHIKVHMERHKCSKCDVIFKKRCTYLRHMNLHAQELAGEKVRHIRTATITCKICYRSLNPKSMKRHMRLHGERKKYKCDFCDKTFNTLRILRSHLKIIHKQLMVNCKQGLEGERLRLNISSKQLFKCPVCGLVFIHHNELGAHIRIHTGLMPYQCTVCQETFNGRHHLQDHMNTVHITTQKIYQT